MQILITKHVQKKYMEKLTESAVLLLKVLSFPSFSAVM